MRTFHHTSKALRIYDVTKAVLDVGIETATTEVKLNEYLNKEELAKSLVRNAYHMDTADINSAGSCWLLSIEDIRRISQC